jgi:hypothetical protein
LQQSVSIDLYQLQWRSAELCVDVATTASSLLRKRIRRDATRSQYAARFASADAQSDTRKKAPRRAGLDVAAARLLR